MSPAAKTELAVVRWKLRTTSRSATGPTRDTPPIYKLRWQADDWAFVQVAEIIQWFT